MNGEFIVMEDGEYDQWLSGQQESADSGDSTDAEAAVAPAAGA